MTLLIDGVANLYSHSQIKRGEQLVFPNTRSYKQYSHRIFNRYPARSISLVPRAILRELSPEEPQAKVLDPFMGSGTTAVEAVLQGMRPYGVEIDPFARLVTSVRTHLFKKDELESLNSLFSLISKKWREYSPDESLLPKLNNIQYWFTDTNFQNLLKLKTCIYAQTEEGAVRNFFRIVLADMIRPCSKAERQTLKPYISKKYEKQPAIVSDAFAKSFKSHSDALKEFEEYTWQENSGVEWLGFDGTDFKCQVGLDVAITSPPYINALDYVRCTKMESAWADCNDEIGFQKLRKNQVGETTRIQETVDDIVQNRIFSYTEQIKKTDPKRANLIAGYFNDMYQNLQCVYRTLKKDAEYHIIVGDSIIREVYVPTHSIIAKLGEAIGFDWVMYYNYKIKDHRTSIPRQGNGGKIDVEHVVTLRKI